MRNMIQTETLELYKEEIKEKMVECYRDVLESPQIQLGIYIWSDGEFQILTDVQGGNSWLEKKDWEERDLFYVTTIKLDPGFDIWDWTCDPKPDDRTEAEKYEKELIDEFVSEYEADIERTFDEILDQIREIERYNNEEWLY